MTFKTIMEEISSDKFLDIDNFISKKVNFING